MQNSVASIDRRAPAPRHSQVAAHSSCDRGCIVDRGIRRRARKQRKPTTAIRLLPSPRLPCAMCPAGGFPSVVATRRPYGHTRKAATQDLVAALPMGSSVLTFQEAAGTAAQDNCESAHRGNPGQPNHHAQPRRSLLNPRCRCIRELLTRRPRSLHRGQVVRYQLQRWRCNAVTRPHRHQGPNHAYCRSASPILSPAKVNRYLAFHPVDPDGAQCTSRSCPTAVDVTSRTSSVPPITSFAAHARTSW